MAGGTSERVAARPTLPREPALDGVRALAVLAVVAFHGEATWAPGGFLGVDVFFVLSGYLITRLLLVERSATGGIDLGGFWSRRMRRILPALVVLIGGLLLLGLVGDLPTGSIPTLPGDSFAALMSVANWRFLASDQGYFASTESPSLLEHTWSLSIEEQFYLLWAPLLAFLAHRVSRRGGTSRAFPLRGLLVGTLLGVAVSAVWMWQRAADPWTESHAYWDTLARLQGPLIGAALAMVLTTSAASRLVERTSRLLATLLAAAGLVVLLVMFARLDSSTSYLYPGGFLLAAVASASLIAGLHLHPRGNTARALALPPVVALGVISYGVYLWHWPLLLVVTGSRTGLDGVALQSLRFVLTLVIATASYVLVERPIRARCDGFVRTAGGFALAGAGLVIGLVVLVPISDDGEPTADLVLPKAEDFVPPDDGAPFRPTAVPPRSDLIEAVPDAETTVPASTFPRTLVQPATSVATVPPTTIPPPAASVPAGPPVRMAFFGDSVAQSLARALAPHGPEYNVEVIDNTILGCGVLRSGAERIAGKEYEIHPMCSSWGTTWEEQLAHQQPELAVFALGRHEVFDHRYLERWTAIGDPTFDQYVSSEVEAVVALARRQGVPVVLLTAPFFAGGEAPGGGIRPENHPARVHRFNQIIGTVAANNADLVSVVDLGGLVSPGGVYATTIDGVLIRDDGVHFAGGAGAWLAPRLLLDLAWVTR